jgi:hypothetical protein
MAGIRVVEKWHGCRQGKVKKINWHKKAQFGKEVDRWEDIHEGWTL